MTKAIWNKNGLELKIIGYKTGALGEKCALVCKATAKNPQMGLFSIRLDELTIS